MSLGREPQLTYRLDLAPTDLPRRWLARQLTDEPPAPAGESDDCRKLVARALDEQSVLAAIAGLEREDLNLEQVGRRMPEALAEARRRLRIPVALALPGVSQAYARRAYTSALRRRIEPLPAVDEADTDSLDIDMRSDALVERAAIECVTAHRALARGGLGLTLPSLRPEAFGLLAAPLPRRAAPPARAPPLRRPPWPGRPRRPGRRARTPPPRHPPGGRRRGPASHRPCEVLLLWAWAELEYVEIARALDVPTGTVRSRLNRARRRVRNTLEEER